MTSAPASEASSTPPPRQLGEYEIIAEIAKGGMGVVYLARRAGSAGFQRLFAIKAMHPHLAEDSAFVDMLWDEARLAARLHHHNVVPVLDVGTDRGIPYVVMEYVDGCSLAALLVRNRQSRSPELLVPIFIDALEGLHAAHTLEDDDGNPLHLVHRDVTPQNILIGADGTARIIDFGIAKAEARVTTTRPGVWKGKFAYMAPEQLVGDGEDVDQRADIFAAGAVLWTALTGRRLFRGESDGATLHNVLHKDVPPPSTVGFQPPAVYDAICLCALERNRDKRYASAREMAEALRGACKEMASRAAVAHWVMTSFEAELAERRAAVRGAAQAPPRTQSVVVPALPALGVPVSRDSWPHEHHTPVSTTPAHVETGPSSLAPHAEVTQQAVFDAPIRRSRLWLAVVPLLLVAGIVVAILASGGEETPVQASQGTSAAVPVATAPKEPAVPPTTTSEPEEKPSATAAPEKTARPVAVQPWHPRPKATAKPEPSAAPPAETAAPKPTAQPTGQAHVQAERHRVREEPVPQEVIVSGRPSSVDPR